MVAPKGKGSKRSKVFCSPGGCGNRSFLKYAVRGLLVLLALRAFTPYEYAYKDERTKANVLVSEKPKYVPGASTTTFSYPSTTHATPGSVIVLAEEPDQDEETTPLDGLATSNRNTTSFSLTRFTSKPACHPLPTKEVSFTLTTQLSIDRMWIMKHQCERWPPPHPISIAVYLPANSDEDEAYVETKLRDELRCGLSRMTLTILKGHRSMTYYPVNTLRNLAIQGVQTSHAAYIDSDFLVSSDLYQDLQTMASVVSNDSQAAIVMPAFTYKTKCPFETHGEAIACLEAEWNTFMPQTKDELLPMLQRSEYPKVEVGYEGSLTNRYHSTTMYTKWRNNQTEPVHIPCYKTPAYEPYLAVRVCRDLPEFPTVFRGWGWNKVIWILWLWKKLNYSLWQMPQGFVMHLPHPDSVSHKKNIAEKKQKKKKVKVLEKQARIQQDYIDWFGTIPDHPNQLPQCYIWKKLSLQNTLD